MSNTQPMSTKKLTPLQQAIAKCDELASTKANSRDALHCLRDLKNYLQSLLPSEKEFALDMWLGGRRQGFQEGENRDEEDNIEKAQTFQEHYKQYQS